MLPHVAVVREPVVDVLERGRIELIQAIAPDLDLAHELGLAQNAQMPGNSGTADREIARDAAHRLAAVLQQRQNRAPGGIGQRLEHIARVRFFGNYFVTHWLNSTSGISGHSANR